MTPTEMRREAQRLFPGAGDDVVKHFTDVATSYEVPIWIAIHKAIASTEAFLVAKELAARAAAPKLTRHQRKLAAKKRRR